MERRRSLGGFFKFFIEPTELNFAYGKQKTLTNEDWLLEVGTITGSYSTVTKKSTITQKNESYWKLEGRGAGKETVAFINFKTYKANQVVQLAAFDECNSPNDFLAIGKLDSLDRSPLKAKLNNSTEQTISFTVPTAGSHFIKVYYYQHNDADTASYSVTTHTTHAGYIRFISYYNQYPYGYDKPDVQQILVKSYTGWILVSKPAWINLDKTYDRSGKKYLTIECIGNPGAARTGSLILKEKRKDTQITVTINQAANPHPNDIILSIDKDGGIVNENGKSLDIKVKLIGETSYTISNVSSNQYSVTKSSDGNNITVKNNSSNNTGKQNVSFKITGNNGTSKDINIYEDGIECYCDCNEDIGCGCHVEQTYNKKKISCDGCHNGYEACVSDDGSCISHQSVLCECYGSEGCTGCHRSHTTGQCTSCYNSVGCSCHSTYACNSCHGTVSCACHSSNTCSNCHGSVGCTCNRSLGCNICHGSVSCTCNSSQGCNICHGSVSCNSCHQAAGSGNCNVYNDPNAQISISFKISHNLPQVTGNMGCRYLTFLLSKNGGEVGYYHLVPGDLPIEEGTSSSVRTFKFPALLNGSIIKAVRIYASNNTRYDISGTVKISPNYFINNYTVSLSFTRSDQYGVYSGAPFTSSSCEGYESGRFGCLNCNSGYSLAYCDCDGNWGCGCHSSNTCNSCYGSVGCSCHSSKTCSDCYGSVGCSCHSSQGCNICHGSVGCTCNSSLGCNICHGSVSCTGCHGSKTNDSCQCQNSFNCTGCNSGHDWGTCSCYNSKSCTGCYQNYSSSCTCHGTQSCTGCHSGYGSSCNSCYNSQSCSGCHGSQTSTGSTSQTCTNCYSGNWSSNCLCQNTYATEDRISSGCTCFWGHTCYAHNIKWTCSCEGSVSCSCKSSVGGCTDCLGTYTAASCTVCDTSEGCFCNGKFWTAGCNCDNTYTGTGCSQCYLGYNPYNNPTCTCEGSYVQSCSGCYVAKYNVNTCEGQTTPVACNGCKGSATAEYCESKNTAYCNCKGSVSCTCDNSYYSSCQCDGGEGGCMGCNCGHGVLVGCDSCYGGWSESHCSCYGGVSCGCKSGYSTSCTSCYNTNTCTGCHGSKTETCPCQNGYGCNNCHGSKTESCLCQGSVGCNKCDTAYTEYTCVCNSKVFHPHCDCHEYCPCEGYVIPVVN